MIEDRIGDLFDPQHQLDYIVHQTNLYHIFGSGIAKTIRGKFPFAYEADCQGALRGNRNRLGTFELANSPSVDWPISGIINMYSQDGISATDRTTNYAAMGAAFWDLELFLRDLKMHLVNPRNPVVLGIPYGIGCGLAGGDWNVVRPIIESAFGNSAVKAVICRLPQ